MLAKKYVILFIFIFLFLFTLTSSASQYEIGGGTTSGGNAGKFPDVFIGMGGNYRWAKDTSGIKKVILDKHGNIFDTQWEEGDWFAWTTSDIAEFRVITKDISLKVGYEWVLDTDGNIKKDADGSYLIRKNNSNIKLAPKHFSDRDVKGFDATYGTHFYKIIHPVDEERYCFNGVSHPTPLPYGTLMLEDGTILVYKGYKNLFEYVYNEIGSTGIKTNTIRVSKKILEGGGFTISKAISGDYSKYGVNMDTEYSFKLKSNGKYVDVKNKNGSYEYVGLSSNGSIMKVSPKNEASITKLPNGEYFIEEIKTNSDIFEVEYDKNPFIISNSAKSGRATIYNIYPFGTKLEIKKNGIGKVEENGYQKEMQFKFRIKNSNGKYITTKLLNGEYSYIGESSYGSEMVVSEINPAIVNNVPYDTYYVEEVVPDTEIGVYQISYSPNMVSIDNKNKESTVFIYNNFTQPPERSFELNINKNVISNFTDKNRYSFNIQDSITKKYVQGDGSLGVNPSNFWVDANSSTKVRPSVAGEYIITETTTSSDFTNIVNGNPVKLNFRNKNGSATIINTYNTVPSITPTPRPPTGGGNDPDISSHPDSECKWKNPPDQKKEFKTSLIYIVENKNSNVENTSTVILDRMHSSAKQLFDNPITSYNYEFESIEKEVDVTLNIQARQVLLEKHTWYSYNPRWKDTYQDGYKHPDNSCRSSVPIYRTIYCEHTKTGKCNVEGCPGPQKKFIGYERDGTCDHPKWVYPDPSTPQWIKNVDYKMYDAGTISKTRSYIKNVPKLSYTYFKPLNLGTASNLSKSETRSLIGEFNLISNQGIEASINNYQNNPGVMHGIDNNSPIKFFIEFSNEQFGIPKYGSDGIKMEDSKPAEGVYNYDEQYYWNSKLFFSSNAKDYSNPPITSLEYEKNEKIGVECFSRKANTGFNGGVFYYRAIRSSDNEPFLLGSNSPSRRFWSCEFEYGLRYRYGIRYKIEVKTGNPVTSTYSESFTTKHKCPSKSNFKSKYKDATITFTQKDIHNVHTGELEGKVNNQPILYGEFDIKTSAGY